MKARSFRLALTVSGTLLSVVLASACGGASTPEPAMTTEALSAPPATLTATVAPAATPSAEELALLNAIADALRSGDPQALRPLIGFGQVPCSARPAQGLGAPPACAPGEDDGEPVDVFYLSTCEGEYLRPSEVGKALDILATTSLYGVYRLPPQHEASGEYTAIVFQGSPDEKTAWEAVIDDGRIVALMFSCATTPAELIGLRGYTEAVLPPQTP